MGTMQPRRRGRPRVAAALRISRLREHSLSQVTTMRTTCRQSVISARWSSSTSCARRRGGGDGVLPRRAVRPRRRLDRILSPSLRVRLGAEKNGEGGGGGGEGKRPHHPHKKQPLIIMS